MAAMAVFRTYRSPGDVLWIVVMPVAISFLLSLWFGGPGGTEAPAGLVVFENPRGDERLNSFPELRTTFAFFLLFCLAGLITRAGAIHEERQGGTLSRTIACGIPYRDVVAAHVASIGITGLIQAVLILAFTGLLGVDWLAAGLPALLLPTVFGMFSCAGIAVGVAGYVRKEGHLQLITGALPNLLAMLGGAFFPLDGAPANVQRLAVVNPVYWSMRALEAGYLHDGLAGQAGPLAVLFLVGVLGMVLGVQGLRRMEA